MQHEIKKVTQKDRYGNQISYEFEAPVKPLDQTAIVKEMMKETVDMNGMNIEVPEIEIGGMDEGHPGEPKGSDTVPAWLTPGEFVVNAEAMRIPGAQETVEAINDQGRSIQQEQGGSIPSYDIGGKVSKLYKEGYKAPGQAYAIAKSMGYEEGGMIHPHVVADNKKHSAHLLQDGGPVPFLAGPLLTDPSYMQEGGPTILQQIVAQSKAAPLHEQGITKYDTHAERLAKELARMRHEQATLKGYDDGGWVTDELLDALRYVESRGDNKAVSKAGAVGEYQWLPSSAKQAGYGVKAFDPLDPKAARAATKKYLENMQKYHGFTPEETLQAYNWGPGNVLKYKSGKRKDVPKEAQEYAGKVLKQQRNIKGPETLPTTRPEGIPIGNVPTRRPDMLDYHPPVPAQRPEGGTNQDHLKSFLDQYLAEGGYPNPNVDQLPIDYQPIAESIALGGEEDVDYTGDTFETQGSTNPMYDGIDSETVVPVDDYAGSVEQQDLPWYSSLLGHKSKEALGIPLTENENRLQAEANKFDSAINPSLVGDDPVGEGYAEEGDVKGGIDQTGEEIVTDAETGESANKKEVKEKILNKIDEEAKKDPNSTGPGEDQKGNNATEEEVVKAAEQDPSLIEKAGGFLKEAFGELFDPKELARAAILYAGSRALGYNHSGSMQYAAKGYLKRIESAQAAKIEAAATRDKRAFELAKTDKFTPASVNAYKKSGNPADLVSKKSTAGAIPTGVTEQRLLGGKKVSIQQVKTPNGSTGYLLPNGQVVSKATLENKSKPYQAAFDKGTPEYRTRRARATKSASEIFKQIQSREGKYKVGDETKYRTGIIPAQAAQDFWTFAEKYGIDPESDEALDIMGNAYQQAIQQSSLEDAPVAKDLKPFLEAQYIRQQTGNPQLFQLNPDKDAKESPKYVRSDLMAKFMDKLDDSADAIPSLREMNSTDKRNKLVDALLNKWGAMSEDERKQWNARANEGKETGFYLFATEEADGFILNRKLGE